MTVQFSSEKLAKVFNDFGINMNNVKPCTDDSIVIFYDDNMSDFLNSPLTKGYFVELFGLQSKDSLYLSKKDYSLKDKETDIRLIYPKFNGSVITGYFKADFLDIEHGTKNVYVQTSKPTNNTVKAANRFRALNDRATEIETKVVKEQPEIIPENKTIKTNITQNIKPLKQRSLLDIVDDEPIKSTQKQVVNQLVAEKDSAKKVDLEQLKDMIKANPELKNILFDLITQ